MEDKENRLKDKEIRNKDEENKKIEHLDEETRQKIWNDLANPQNKKLGIQLPCKYRHKRWELVEVLGEGAFAEVRLMVDSENKETMFAVKCVNIKKQRDAKEAYKVLRKEALIMRLLRRNEFIIRFVGMRYMNGEIQIFQEYAYGGEVFDLIEPDFGMPTWKAQNFFRQLIAGVKHIHKLGIAHRDIKPENLLLAQNDQLKICDFGLATIFRHRNVERKLHTKCGTIQYIAPEVIQGEYRAEASDIWSCGVVLVTMLSGELPWEEPTKNSQTYRHWLHPFKWRYDSPWERFCGITLSLLRRMLDENENKRIMIPIIEEHDFFILDAPGSPSGSRYGPIVQKPRNKSDEANRSSENNDNPVPSQPHVEDNIVLHETVDEQAQNQEPVRKKRKISPNLNAGRRSRLSGSFPVSQPNPSRNILESSKSFSNKLTNFFSQPVGMELLTQNEYNSNQHPLTLLARRMTRFCVTTTADETVCLIGKRLDCQFTCVRRAANILSITGPRNRMSFVVTIYEIVRADGKMIMVDCRRSRGDGIEFKRAFLDLKRNLDDILFEAGNSWLEKQGLKRSIC